MDMKADKDPINKPLIFCSVFLLTTIAVSAVFLLKGSSLKYPNIVLITMDTTRVDRLGCYGFKKNTSPNIDLLAEKSIIFTNAYSNSSWTLPSHASLFTGKFTSSHGARFDREGPLKLGNSITGYGQWKDYKARGLASNETTLARMLAMSGYITAGIVAGPWLKKVFGINRGFLFYDDDQIGTLQGRTAEQVTASALNFLDNVKDKRFFLFLNYFDPHEPRWAPREFVEDFLDLSQPTSPSGRPTVRQNSELYNAEIKYMDYYIGIFIDRLKKLNLYEDSWIIVTADHGELLGEKGRFGHGHFLTQEEIHVPLLMKYPGMKRKKVEHRPIQLIDIFSTILKRLNIPLPKGIQGTPYPRIRHPLISEVYPPASKSEYGTWKSIISNNYKALQNSKGNDELYHLGRDPFTKKNIIDQAAEKADDMINKMNYYLEGLPETEHDESYFRIDGQTTDTLKSLGYLN